MSMTGEQHLLDVARYCDDVMTGRRPACKWEIAAVQRHLDGLSRQHEENFPYVFDEHLAARPIIFGETFPHVKGKWASRVGKDALIKLEPWQKFILAVLFGWVHKDTYYRKHRIAYVCVPRKNGKSVLAAIIGLYMLVEDGEYGAEIYCGATSEKQAWEVFRPAQKMALKKPSFLRAYGVGVHAKKLEIDRQGIKPLRSGGKRPIDGSRFEPVIGKPGDGASPSLAILDEMHEHMDDTLYDTMLTGMGAREQPMLLIITTAGYNIAGVCFSVQKEVEAVLGGKVEDDPELFGIIYTVDDIENEWRTEAGMLKANPNAGISVGIPFLKARVRDAERSPRKKSTILTKHFDIWTTAKEAWLNMLEWNNCADESLTEDAFDGEQAVAALDLSERDDITANVRCFTRDVDGVKHYYFSGRYYVTEEKANDESNAHYRGWVEDGYLDVCDGSYIDTEQVEEDVKADIERFSIRKLGYDPFGAGDLANRIVKHIDNVEAIKIQQNYTNFSIPMREFERLLSAGRIHHDGNPALTWMMGNVVAQRTRDGKMMRPIKESDAAKNDGAVALLMSFILAYTPDDDEEGDWDDYLESLADYGKN